ncbi:MAG: arginine repressor [Eubacterium sp.]|nr:arginine repressor [Eubacterium sp.]MBQ8981771.1 arginine repressor [Eubacterium sp.]MBR1531000.1 arginine repressor [Eubacterium sp.]MBR2278842.1 arginine repressor [Eubacterium sp.]
MKKRRQAKILEIITSQEIETQEELQELLNVFGFEVTQATISRDIKELRLVKELSSEGRYFYSTGKKNTQNINRRAGGIFNESIIKIDYALNTVVIKCFAGMANAACAAIDSMELKEVLGSIAGDDTIFILCTSEENAREFTQKLRNMLNAY